MVVVIYNMELKEIPTNQIIPNPEQPRETFERDKLRELSDSIKEIGLINPITVRKKGSQFEIVTGERRWRAHQIGKIGKVPAIIKEYKQDVDAQIESLVENLQREDLTSIERENFVGAIWDTGKFKTHEELAKKIGSNQETINELITAKKIRANEKYSSAISTRQIRAVRSLDENTRRAILKKAEEGKLGGEKAVREYSRTIKKATPEVKDALLDDKITVDQAERISKLDSERARKKAIQEHQALSLVEKSVERNIENQMSAREKRQFDKQLLQSGNWVMSFRGSVTDFYSQGEKTLKILLLATKFISVMDDKQRERLNIDLNRLIETSEKIKQLAEQVEEKINE